MITEQIDQRYEIYDDDIAPSEGRSELVINRIDNEDWSTVYEGEDTFTMRDVYDEYQSNR